MCGQPTRKGVARSVFETAGIILTVTGLAKAPPYSRIEQEQSIGL
ncbi:MAG: hypothetical protein WA624_20625 [Methylocella sp.]